MCSMGPQVGPSGCACGVADGPVYEADYGIVQGIWASYGMLTHVMIFPQVHTR